MKKLKAIALAAALALVAVGTSACGEIGVYMATKEGEAELAKARSSKQVATETAKAKYESADYEAKAEIRRAEGVAEANRIIGNSLKDNEAYLRYLYVNNLEKTQNQIIYVPTEAGLPILESGRRPPRPAPAAE
jgi:regulator of protease activity HflC (stomatin/prohibitin superfamily)